MYKDITSGKAEGRSGGGGGTLVLDSLGHEVILINTAVGGTAGKGVVGLLGLGLTPPKGHVARVPCRSRSKTRARHIYRAGRGSDLS